MSEQNKDSPAEVIDQAVESSKQAIELQNEANQKAPKSPEEIVEKAKEQNKDPEALAGSPEGVAKESQNLPETPAELYKKLAEGPKEAESEYQKKLEQGSAGRETYLKLADVPAVPPTNLAAASLSGAQYTDDLVKSNLAASGTSGNSVVVVPETSPIDPVTVASTPGQASGSSIAAIRSTVDVAESTPGRAHLNPVKTQTSANAIETPGYNPTLPGSVRLNPVKVPGNPPSVVDVPHDGFLAKGKHSSVPSVNLPPSSAVVPLALSSIRSVNVPPMAADGNQLQTYVNVPGSINVPPGPTGVARTGTNPHMNPVKLAGTPLVIQTPVNIVPNGAVLNIAETPASIDNTDTTAELVEHFVVEPDQDNFLIEHFVDGPDSEEPGTSAETKSSTTSATKTPKTSKAKASVTKTPKTNKASKTSVKKTPKKNTPKISEATEKTETTPETETPTPETKTTVADTDVEDETSESSGDVEETSDSESSENDEPDVKTEILNPKKTPDDEGGEADVVAPKKTGEIDAETPAEVYEQLQDAQKLEVTEEKKETDEPQEVYKKLQNAQPELVQQVNASRTRDVHLNPTKVPPGGVHTVLTTPATQVAQAVSKLDIQAPPSHNIPGSGDSQAKYVVSSAVGNVHLNPAVGSAPSIIHTPDNLVANAPGSVVRSVNLPGAQVTIPLATGGSAVNSVNVPPMVTNTQTGPAGSIVGPSTNVPSGPITVNTQQ